MEGVFTDEQQKSYPYKHEDKIHYTDFPNVQQGQKIHF